ncbi:MAG: hypothetical protein IH987_11925 [Planctomycetes bacterium]|nr:hypothetical protein [Planctomycetota bacterium]
MPKNLSPGVAMLMMTLLLAAGCDDSRDERFRRLAQQALREQSEQNKRMADQNREIAEASKHLVENDSQARKEMIAAHGTLQKELQTERTNIHQQLSDLESERREISKQRGRDPIIAQAIGAVGLTLSCLLPLLLAGYVIYSLNRRSDDSDALSEMLVMEMTADQPLLLPSSLPTVAAIEHTPSSLDAPDEPDQADDQ